MPYSIWLHMEHIHSLLVYLWPWVNSLTSCTPGSFWYSNWGRYLKQIMTATETRMWQNKRSNGQNNNSARAFWNFVLSHPFQKNEFVINSWLWYIRNQACCSFICGGFQASLVLFSSLATLEVSAQTEMLILSEVCITGKCQKSSC